MTKTMSPDAVYREREIEPSGYRLVRKNGTELVLQGRFKWELHYPFSVQVCTQYGEDWIDIPTLDIPA